MLEASELARESRVVLPVNIDRASCTLYSCTNCHDGATKKYVRYRLVLYVPDLLTVLQASILAS